MTLIEELEQTISESAARSAKRRIEMLDSDIAGAIAHRGAVTSKEHWDSLQPLIKAIITLVEPIALEYERSEMTSRAVANLLRKPA